ASPLGGVASNARGWRILLPHACREAWLDRGMRREKSLSIVREATRRLGAGRILNTPGIYVLSIQGGLITVAAADEAKAILEKHRFQMAFRSFSDLLSRLG